MRVEGVVGAAVTWTRSHSGMRCFAAGGFAAGVVLCRLLKPGLCAWRGVSGRATLARSASTLSSLATGHQSLVRRATLARWGWGVNDVRECACLSWGGRRGGRWWEAARVGFVALCCCALTGAQGGHAASSWLCQELDAGPALRKEDRAVRMSLCLSESQCCYRNKCNQA